MEDRANVAWHRPPRYFATCGYVTGPYAIAHFVWVLALRSGVAFRRYGTCHFDSPNGPGAITNGFFLALGFCWQLQRGREAKLHHLVLRWPIPQVSVAVACAEASLLSTCVTAAHRFLSLAESDQEIGLGTGLCWNTEFGWGALRPSRNCAANCPAVPPASCGPGGFAAASHPASAPVAVQEWPARWW